MTQGAFLFAAVKPRLNSSSRQIRIRPMSNSSAPRQHTTAHMFTDLVVSELDRRTKRPA